MKPSPTRTTNPLHFEDLDPHRFEDLVRQLAYDFRSWAALEAIGRSGDDGGVDIRGIEAFAEGEDAPDEAEPRTWLIQAKRETSFGPAKAGRVAGAAKFDAGSPPHGFVLAVTANVSRRTRDVLADRLRDRGVPQVIVWGRGELEDLLYLPSHDHLLFAYFGVSLSIRKRGLTAELRQRLTKKRQVFAALGALDHRGHTAVLLRDPTVAGYPFPDRVDNFDGQRPPWRWTWFQRHSNPDTVALAYRRHHAWLSEDGESFDVLESCSHTEPRGRDHEEELGLDKERCDRAWRFFHHEIPEAQRAWVLHVGWIPLDDILLVDDLGDAFNQSPHLLVTQDHAHGFFSNVKTFIQREPNYSPAPIAPPREWKVRPIEELNRISLFPDPLPDVEITDRW